MTESEFKELFKKYIAGTASPEEIRQVDAFFERYQHAALQDEYRITGDENEVRNKVLQGVYAKHSTLQRKSQRMLFWRVAASLLVLVTAGYFLMVRNTKQNDAKPATAQVIRPGSDKAILKLGDGSSIELDSIHQASIPRQGSAHVSSFQGGIAYDGNGQQTELIYNTIITPRGGQYQVELSDGTKVWLNASSSLHFPVAFAGSERQVELTGEAYFEVAENKSKPFKVKVGEASVQVLGTHFNIMAYGEESAIQTSLVEGSVKIIPGDKLTNTDVVLSPGEQARLTRDGKVNVVSDAEVIEQAVAWRFGLFRFDDTDLKTIMRQVSRWYDAEITYDGTFGDISFVGVVSRKADVSSILRRMELTGEVHFEVTPGRIIVKPGRKKLSDIQ